MGCFEMYCSFCAGPLSDARSDWLSFLEERLDMTLYLEKTGTWPPKDGEWRNPPGYPVPTKSKEEIVVISPEDGFFWSDWVCFGKKWKETGWVSPPCTQDSYGASLIDGSSDWEEDEPCRYQRIHRGCLSFLCRRLGITPQILWESFYQPGADYLQCAEEFTGLLSVLEYYDMEGRNDQFFRYALLRDTLSQDDSEPEKCEECWDDPESMEDAAWLLSRPTRLTPPTALEPLTVTAEYANSGTACMQVFGVPELLDLVLSAVIEVSPHDITMELKEPDTDFDDAPSLISATESLLALCPVDCYLHNRIIGDCQGLFLRLATRYGWMLPSTPADWVEWRQQSGPKLDLRLDQSFDWRKYLLSFLRKEDRVVRNRWRFHRIAVQYARGQADPAFTRWGAGELGLASSTVSPEAWSWELPPPDTEA
ncbi:hypothetical protein C8R45DRAFT_1160359 [Mycena sanguinolenta]|nr:hypothetical protein C8R45DRAFT_1160359 [Mycena sanguinolenta]